MPKDEVAIRGDRQMFLPSGQVGQVMLRGPSVTPGYLQDIDGVPGGLENGWLPTGDLGRIDQDGFLTIVGRTKEIINRGGEKIAPYDIEKALLRHPAVREAAAFAVPHPRLGENVGAAVVLHPGASATSSELLTFLYNLLAPFQMPRQVHVLDSLPLGVTGKISRPQLTAIFANVQKRPSCPTRRCRFRSPRSGTGCSAAPTLESTTTSSSSAAIRWQATEMLLELEEVTHHRITAAEIRAELTINQLSDIMVGRKRGCSRGAGGQGQGRHRFATVPVPWRLRRLGLLCLRAGRVPEISGSRLVIHSNLDEGAGIDSIEEMARRYLPHMLTVWPEGPLRLPATATAVLPPGRSPTNSRRPVAGRASRAH